MSDNTPPPVPHAPSSDETPRRYTTTLRMLLAASLGVTVDVRLPEGAIEQSLEDGPYVDSAQYGPGIMAAIIAGAKSRGADGTWKYETLGELWTVSVRIDSASGASHVTSRSYNVAGRLYLGNLPLVASIEIIEDSE